MNTVDQRRNALIDLVELRRPVEETRTRLRAFGWDSDDEFVSLGPGEIANILHRFLDHELTAEDVADWADAVEARDDVAFASQAVIDAVYQLANPALEGSLTAERATRLLATFESIQPRPDTH